MSRSVEVSFPRAAAALAGVLLTGVVLAQAPPADVRLGERPYGLVTAMDDGALKDALAQCRNGPFYRTSFSIAHRGAPLEFPEHTREGYLAAARQGAGVIECDVTFTRDRALVCRHSQCDLHTTTNILATGLAGRCSQPFVPANPGAGTPATARCCTSDVTLAEFKSLCGRMDAADPTAVSVEDYLAGKPALGRRRYEGCGTLMTHAESIELFAALGVAMTPELKVPEVPMPFQGDYGRERFARQMLDEYRSAGVRPDRVWPQSFSLDDVRYWIRNDPAFARQAVFLDGRLDAGTVSPAEPERLTPTMEELAEEGVRIVAPPLWVLVTLDADGRIVPSAYARAARAAGLDIITWTLERSGPLENGGGYYYQSVADAIDDDGDVYELLDVLARDVGVIGVFSDWPATVTYYASCIGLR